MLSTEKDFCEYASSKRRLARERWNQFSKKEILDSLKSFETTKVCYSSIGKDAIYSDLGYFASDLDCLYGKQKPKELSDNKPCKGPFFIYRFNEDKLKMVYQNDGKKDLTGDLLYIVNDNVRVSLSDCNETLNYIVEIIDTSSFLERITIEQKGEMISCIVFSKSDNRFFLFQSQLFFESLDEIRVDEKMDVFYVNSIYKRLKTNDEIHKSMSNCGLHFSDKAIETNINMLKEGGFKYYEF